MNREHYCRLLVLLAPACLMAGQARADYTETNLISNEVGVAPITDANLVDPWGLAFSATSPLWVSNQGSGTATVYKITGTSSSATQLTEGVANIAGAPPSNANGPTGQVSTAAPGVTTGATDFQVNGGKASFIFDNLDSSISAWHGGMTSSLITATAQAHRSQAWRSETPPPAQLRSMLPIRTAATLIYLITSCGVSIPLSDFVSFSTVVWPKKSPLGCPATPP